VLLHELGHWRRGDLWVNHLQALLQVLYWFNPLLWLANTVIQRVREQAVDEVVMVHLRQEADTYPATLLEIAKFSLLRSSARLSLVGIAETRGGLVARINKLATQPVPKSAKVGIVGLLLVLGFAALALPMAKGQRPSLPAGTKPIQPAVLTGNGPQQVQKEDPEIKIASSSAVVLPGPLPESPARNRTPQTEPPSPAPSPSEPSLSARLSDPASWVSIANGCLIQQVGETIRISGTNNIDGWGHGNGIATTKVLPEGDFYATVEFAVPMFKGSPGAGSGNALVYLRAHSTTGKMLAILYQPNAGTYQVQGWGSPNTFSQPPLRKIGDEDKIIHRMKLKYEAATQTAAGWIDDNYIGSLNYTMTGNVYFELLANTDKKGMVIDIFFDNLSVSPVLAGAPPTPATPTRLEPVRPAVSINIGSARGASSGGTPQNNR
jgi:hypothetical protein